MACMQRRMHNEWLALQNDPPPGMTLKERRDQNTITEWVIELKGPPRTLYEGQRFQLLFTFSSRYPYEPPQVMFTGENIPVNPLVYNNGHIRLSNLAEHWSPVLTVRSWCFSIISILCIGNVKYGPPNNSNDVQTCNNSPKKRKWWWWWWWWW
ncbi:ubiquitin-conjugating enzyme E2 W-like [Tachysurus vachellii]|uniref:ubiquitin-conjugating enzyme E2 W-like n=1 Tax=Tachysurus vachellii TaxID=175792 RepID=UPI00296AC4BC|nr:ubiquitin-conjugating enzyme E2 W-like [Tachysurus vachellii]